ncbi:lipid II:glycine glycyltransferase FemX [Agrococcus sp. SGAir0287]|uniref:lipid II:glycine glycyltransferase FemX n=1 Tax=Agrococcus sp. SGAir0287 TaxID=2070347 RepID=UPI0010CD346D|nr:peptidoglycan bridge formation glycyltransferase FemA/FemB family protein [Agrococcus sp. SGAir0287]QCR19482.1 hypothetical protein C1N71_08620 [Agrococcus sp. SGAir0287]
MSGPFTVRAATRDEIGDWDDLIARNPDGGHMVQSAAFAEVKRGDGLEPRFLVIEGPQTIHVLALEGRVWLGRYWYVPLGPTGDDLEGIVAALRAYARAQPGLLVVKIEPRLERTDALVARLTAMGLEPSRDMQVQTHTVVLDLAQGAEALLASFSQSTRRHIRKAERDGYRVERVDVTPETRDRMHAMMQTVAGGKGMEGMRERAYYDRFWQAFADHGTGQLYLGFDDDGDEPQAGIFVTFSGRTAVYKDGGSRPDRRIAGGAPLLLYTAMQDAIARGCTAFDLAGTPPADRLDDPEHPFHGLGQFKTRFGPVTSHLPSFDLVLHPVRHRLWEHGLRRIEWRLRPGPDTLR